MVAFLNECSFHGQYDDRALVHQAFQVFFSILTSAHESQVSVYCRSDLFHSYTLFRDENAFTTLNKIGDKGFITEIFTILYSRLNAIDWLQEQRHSDDDEFVCDGAVVTSTSIAEVTERVLQDGELQVLLINFSDSTFSGRQHIEVTKNGDQPAEISCAENQSSASIWIRNSLGKAEPYPTDATECPADEQTILVDRDLFRKTSRIDAGRKVYCERNTGHFWYVDSLHVGARAHIEVFDSRGRHIGESSLDGNMIPNSRDPTKTYDP